jgi:hypothetical protein
VGRCQNELHRKLYERNSRGRERFQFQNCNVGLQFREWARGLCTAGGLEGEWASGRVGEKGRGPEGHKARWPQGERARRPAGNTATGQEGETIQCDRWCADF